MWWVDNFPLMAVAMNALPETVITAITFAASEWVAFHGGDATANIVATANTTDDSLTASPANYKATEY